jgi:hypothetical protein
MIDIWGGESLVGESAMSPDLSITDSPLQPNVAITQGDVDELMWTDGSGDAAGNAFEDAATRLEHLSFQADGDIAFSEPKQADDRPARRNPLDADAEPVLASDDEGDDPAPTTRKALTELSPDMRTVLFS